MNTLIGLWVGQPIIIRVNGNPYSQLGIRSKYIGVTLQPSSALFYVGFGLLVPQLLFALPMYQKPIRTLGFHTKSMVVIYVPFEHQGINPVNHHLLMVNRNPHLVHGIHGISNSWTNCVKVLKICPYHILSLPINGCLDMVKPPLTSIHIHSYPMSSWYLAAVPLDDISP